MTGIGTQLRSSPRDEARMTLMEHLGELRSRILKVFIAFFFVAVMAWFFRERIFDLLLAPAPSLRGHLNVTSVTEQVLTDLKLVLYAAFLLTIPVGLYQTWAFVAPSVGEVGRAFSYTLVTLASSLFLAGVAFGYLVVLPIGVDFLLSWDPDRYAAIITPSSYFSFTTRFLLAFGIVFELPAATYAGARLGIIDASVLRRHRRHALVINTVLAAALTPGQDPLSMILMAVPMILMYELSIFIARCVNPISEVTVHELATMKSGEGHDEEDPEHHSVDGREEDGEVGRE